MAACLSAFFLLFTGTALAQDHGIAAFSIWRPKAGMEQRFEAGYKQHLQWHQRNGDKWDWYGWYIISGKNFGQFVDATFDHAWNDFDHPVNPAGDGADNNLHTDPFGDYLTAFKVTRMEEASSTDTIGLRSKFTRLITIKFTDPDAARKILIQLKEKRATKGSTKNFQCFRVVDGDNLCQRLIMIGLPDLSSFERTENIEEDLAEIERLVKPGAIREIISEMLLYRGDMSLFAELPSSHR